jgi:methylornithine synthase
MRIDIADERASEILGNALDGKAPSKEEMRHLATVEGTDVSLSLFQVARRITEKNFGHRIFIYGFIYFSTYCRNDCSFCYYRRTNRGPPRYRKSLEQITEAVQSLYEEGIHLVDLTMGEDPQMVEEKGFLPIIEICREVKRRYDMPLMISPGVAPRSILHELARAGVDWYALYQETHNRELYSKLRIGQSYEGRQKAKIDAMREGMLVEDGILLGVGETPMDVVDSVYEMLAGRAHQVRAMGLMPQPGTPLEGARAPPIFEEMKAIAMMRLVHQDRLIPASYDVDGIKGLELRILAGANVVTSLIPPDRGLKGVAQADLDIESSARTAKSIMPYLGRLDLEIAGRNEYTEWVEREKSHIRRA